MTAVTFVGANAGVSGNNAPLAPTIHASAVAADAMVLYATIRNTSAVVATPAGWEPMLADGNVLIAGRYHSGAESAPSVTFTGGAAGDDTLAQIAVFRNVALDAAALGIRAALTNASAQNVALPGPFTPDRDGSLILAAAHKQDDWTGAAALAGCTEIGETVSTAGTDAAQVWDYRIDTTAAATPAGPFAITGGASAASKGLILALPQRAYISVIEQDVFPPRVLVTVSNVIVGDQVAIYRVVGGERTLIRAGSTDAAIDVAFLRVDAELPFGVPVSYVAVVEGQEVASASVVYTLPGGRVALSDAISGASAEAVVGAWPERRYDRQGTVLRPGGRNVVVLDEVGQFESDIELLTETDAQRVSMVDLFRSATAGIVQLRSPDASVYLGVDCFLAVLGFSERRFSQDGSDPRRLWTLRVAEVDGWAPALESTGFTYADLEAAYTGLTYATLASDYATYLALAQADLS